MLWDRTYQVGIVVEDLEAARAHFERAGVGPWVEGPSQHAVERRIHGELADDVEVRGLLAPMGDIELELLQPVRGTSVQREALEGRGEHALHLCAYTDDLDADIREMEAAGFGVISQGVLADGGRFAYFETRAVGGLVLERYELPAGARAEGADA